MLLKKGCPDKEPFFFHDQPISHNPPSTPATLGMGVTITIYGEETMSAPIDDLRSLLAEFATDERPNLEDYTKRFRERFLAYGSETDDNLDAIDRTDVGEFRDSPLAFLAGLRNSRTGYSISDVLNTLEGDPVPDTVRSAMPELTQEDYDAALRIAVLCLTAFENAKPK